MANTLVLQCKEFSHRPCQKVLMRRFHVRQEAPGADRSPRDRGPLPPSPLWRPVTDPAPNDVSHETFLVKKRIRICQSCGKEVKQLRRGMCSACYQRALRGSPAVHGACAICGLEDGRVLRAVKVGEEMLVGCHNHAWLAERSRPKPDDLEAWRELCNPPGDRRGSMGDRRKGKRRRKNERRGEERRVWTRFGDDDTCRRQGDRRRTGSDG